MKDIVEFDTKDDAIIARIVCKNLSLTNIDRLNQSLQRQLDNKPLRYIIDIKKMNYLDSSAIGVILNVMKHVKKYSGRFFLVGVNNTILTVLQMSKVNNILNIRETTEQALSEGV